MMKFQRNFYNDIRFSFLAKVNDWLGAWKVHPGKEGKLSPQTYTNLVHSCIASPKIDLSNECEFDYFLTYFLETDPLRILFWLILNDVGFNYHISKLSNT